MSFFQISEHPERIIDITTLIKPESVRNLVQAMSCDDPEERMSAKEALTKINGLHFYILMLYDLIYECNLSFLK